VNNDPAGIDDTERRLAWILGSSRTGSTWLLRMLVHPWRLVRDLPGVAPAKGASERGPAIVPINETYISTHLAPLVGSEEGRGQANDHLFVHDLKGDRPSYFLSRSYEEVWRPEFRRMALLRLQAQATDAARELGIEEETPSIVVKEPNGSHGAQLLMSLLPQSRLIFLMRDGRDVIDSQLALRLHEGQWQRRHREHAQVVSDKQRLRFVRSRARRWVFLMNTVDAAYAAHTPELRYRLRYEDMRSDTAGELGKLLDWLGHARPQEELAKTVEAHDFENIPEKRKGPGQPARAATVGLWRENLTGPEQDLIAEIAGEKLEELGYSV